jgi:hypothetical protein
MFWTLERECALTLGVGTPHWGEGGQGPQWGPVSFSLVRTGEVWRRSKMAGSKEDDPITASSNNHAQSKCQCASFSNSVNTCHSIVFIVLLFQENKSFGASTICNHPLMYVKPCREQERQHSSSSKDAKYTCILIADAIVLQNVELQNAELQNAELQNVENTKRQITKRRLQNVESNKRSNYKTSN